MKPHQRKAVSTARSQVSELFAQAAVAAKECPVRARRLVHKARRIARHVRLKLPVMLKRRFCRRCETFWVFGTNARVRYRQGMRIVYCLHCKTYTRTPYKTAKK